MKHVPTLPARPAGPRRLRILPTLAISLWAVSLEAHPGHNFADHGPLHLLGSPDHLAGLALAGALCWAAAVLVRRSLPRRVLQAAGIAALAASALLWPTHG